MKSSPPKKDLLGSGWMVISAVCFTLMNLSIKKAGHQFNFNSSELVFWRMLFSVLMLAIIAKSQGKTFTTPYLKAHLSRSISGTLGMFCIFYAIVNLPLSTGVTLSYTSSIFLMILSFIILRERLSSYKQIMVVLGFIGIIILLRPSISSGQELASLVGLCGGLLAGWAYLQVRELSLLGEPSWRVVFYFSLVGTILSGLWILITGWHPISFSSLPYILSIGIFALIGQLCLTRAYQVGDKLTVAALSYLTVVFSTIASTWLLDEKIGWQEIFGMGMIIASGILSSINPSNILKHKHH